MTRIRRLWYYIRVLPNGTHSFEMALCYKPLWKLLIDRDMKRKDLHEVSGVSAATLAKMSRDESVSASILDRICTSLNCDISDVVEVLPSRANAGAHTDESAASHSAYVLHDRA